MAKEKKVVLFAEGLGERAFEAEHAQRLLDNPNSGWIKSKAKATKTKNANPKKSSRKKAVKKSVSNAITSNNAAKNPKGEGTGNAENVDTQSTETGTPDKVT